MLICVYIYPHYHHFLGSAFLLSQVSELPSGIILLLLEIYSSLKLKKNLIKIIIRFFFLLHWVFITMFEGSSPAVVHRPLIAVASLVVEHELYGPWASVVTMRRLSCPAACGIFLDQRSNLCPMHWQVDSQPLDHQGSPP